MATITIGIDLAKLVFSACELDAAGHVRQRRDLRRDALGSWLAQLPAGTVVAMEACSGAHHWARYCLSLGLVPKLIAAQFVTPFRKSRTAKNDRNDAEAIATAARQGNMRFVPVKSIDQQARLAVHRVREGYKVVCVRRRHLESRVDPTSLLDVGLKKIPLKARCAVSRCCFSPAVAAAACRCRGPAWWAAWPACRSARRADRCRWPWRWPAGS